MLFKYCSIWEIAIKKSLNKIELQGEFDQIADFTKENDIELLPVSFEHSKSITSRISSPGPF